MVVVNITLIPITITIASCMLSTWDGVFLGLIYGLTKLFVAYTTPQSVMDTLVFQNPSVTVLPKLAIGFIASIVFHVSYKQTKKLSLSAILASCLASLTNTTLTLLAMVIFTQEALLTIYHIQADFLLKILLSIVITNGLPEMLANCIITPLVVKILWPKFKKH